MTQSESPAPGTSLTDKGAGRPAAGRREQICLAGPRARARLQGVPVLRRHEVPRGLFPNHPSRAAKSVAEKKGRPS